MIERRNSTLTWQLNILLSLPTGLMNRKKSKFLAGYANSTRISIDW